MKKLLQGMVLIVVVTTLILTGCSNPENTETGDIAVIFTGLTANGSSTVTTTKLTLTFDKDINALSAADIAMDAGTTGATKGSLTRTGTGIYDLAVAGIIANGSVTILVSKSGYAISGGSKTVTIYHYTSPTDITVNFIHVTADGSNTATTTKLTLVFDKDITGLSAADIALDSGSTESTKGNLTKTGTGIYDLTVAGITAGGSVTVSVSKSGYNVTGGSKTVTVYHYISPTDITAAFTHLAANGSSTVTTTKLTLTFDKDINALSAADIAMDAGTTGASTGSLTRIETGVYELAVSGITSGGSVTVAVSKSGYNITGGHKTATIYYYAAPTTYYVNYNANGGTGTMERSTFTSGETHTLPPNTFIRSGYVFSGWAQTTVGVMVYADCASVTDLTAAGGSVTLYAVWELGTLVPGATLGVQLNWLEANAGSDMRYIVDVRNNETISPRTLSYSGKTNITILLRGSGGMKTIGLVSNGSMFTVGSGNTLILDSNVTLQGRYDNNASLVKVNDGGTLFMNSETKIIENTVGGGGEAVIYGGGVFVSANGTFTMTGGKISGNIANSGGGVYVRGTFTMTGGEVSGNYAQYGGGVYVDGTFTMNDGEISGNYADEGFGGGVYVNGRFTKSGGIITGYTDDTTKGNVVGTPTNNIIGPPTNIIGWPPTDIRSNCGHAVYVNPGIKCRENTAGSVVNLNSNVAGVAGGWDENIALTVNTWANGNITSSGSQQFFKFTATASTQYIHVSFNTLTSLSVQVYNSNGTTVGSQTNLNSSTRYTSRTVTTGQEYYMLIRSSSRTGTYRIAFNTSTTPPP